MCGRFSNRSWAEKIKREFKVSEVPSIIAFKQFQAYLAAMFLLDVDNQRNHSL